MISMYVCVHMRHWGYFGDSWSLLFDDRVFRGFPTVYDRIVVITFAIQIRSQSNYVSDIHVTFIHLLKSVLRYGIIWPIQTKDLPTRSICTNEYRKYLSVGSEKAIIRKFGIYLCFNEASCSTDSTLSLFLRYGPDRENIIFKFCCSSIGRNCMSIPAFEFQYSSFHCIYPLCNVDIHFNL